MKYKLAFGAGMIVVAALAAQVRAELVGDVYKGPALFPNTNFGGPVAYSTGAFDNNSVQIVTLRQVNFPDPEDHKGGASFTIAVSNGENGFGNTDIGLGPIQPNLNTGPGQTTNPDKPNPTPVGAAIDIVNGGDGTQGNRLQNGNAFRFSVWIQQDPANLINPEAELSVEPVLKFEIFSEAQSIYADYSAGRAIGASFGDRMWDTDVNARDAFYAAHNQSLSSPMDINGNGTLVSGDTPTYTIPPSTGVQWMRVETTLVIDDDPDDSGFGWDVAAQGLGVEHIEEIRATFFMGDFTGDSTPFNNGGRLFLDNALLEVFPSKAVMDATPNPNPMPVASQIGDYNNDGIVDAADYTVWRNFLGQSGANLANRDPSVTGLVKQADYTAWKTRYGNGGPGAGGGGLNASIVGYAPAQAVPEPAAWILGLLASVGAVCKRSRR